MDTLSRQDFQWVCGFLYREAGIALTDDNAYLVENRLGELSRVLGMSGVPQLLQKIRDTSCPTTSRQLIEAMTTNETSFFRDIAPFEVMRSTVIPDLLERCKARRYLRIWSAASSTGQEAYSLAMMLDQHFGEALRDWRVEIVGTDLAEKVLERARSGDYSQLEVNRGLPAPLLMRYFKKKGSRWIICDSIKKMVRFEKINLLHISPSMGMFDIILCRNVMIYFDQDTKKKVLSGLHNCLHPHGYLFLGAAEVLFNITDTFERGSKNSNSFYRPVCKVSGINGKMA